MSSKWLVTSNRIAGMQMYQVYRSIDVNEVDHAGNREKRGPLFENAEQAQRLADKWNMEEGRT